MRTVARAVAIVALLLAVAALAPIASADHAYSHRYIVYGRVVDANDNPVPGITVDMGTSPDFETEGGCSTGQPNTETDAFGPTRTSPVTNAEGFFIFCYHTHTLSRVLPGKFFIRVPEANYSSEHDFDPYTRHSFVNVKLAAPHERANAEVPRQLYTVAGNLWRDGGGETFVEGIRVYGTTLNLVNVTVTLEYNGKEPVTVQTLSNNYGDFAVNVPVTERPSSGKVTIVAENETFTSEVDATYGITALKAEYSELRDPFITKFLIGLGIFAGAVVIVGGGWYGMRKARASREERSVREHSQRRRANK